MKEEEDKENEKKEGGASMEEKAELGVRGRREGGKEEEKG